MSNMWAQIQTVLLLAVPIIVAITLHEAAHGYAARHFGDNTAQDAGRISLNPLRHIDPFGTIILPGLLLLTHAGFLFGYAKPVPVNFGALRHPKQDMVWVAFAGPAMNLALAAISTVLLYLVLHSGFTDARWPAQLLWGSVEINLVLAVFNLWPIPPLDGGKIAIGLLPLTLARPLAQLDRYGMLVLLAIFIVVPMIGIDLFSWMVGRPVDFVERPILSLLGVKA